MFTFSGFFQERKLVNPIQSYRDVIIINDSEKQLKNDLTIVRKRLKDYYKHDYWIGLTEPTCPDTPNGYGLWVESKVNTFGHYWFKIKGFHFRKNEILLRVKMIRPMTNFQNETQNINTENINNVSIEELLENYKNSLKENGIWFLNEVLTIKNIKQALIFICILIMTLVTYIIYGVGYLMEYSLRLIKELSGFVKASTPVMIAVVNIVGKLVFGLYMLIAMLFRKQPVVSAPHQQRMLYYQNRPKAIEMPGYRPRYRNESPRYGNESPRYGNESPRYRNIPPEYRSSVIITEIE